MRSTLGRPVILLLILAQAEDHATQRSADLPTDARGGARSAVSIPAARTERGRNFTGRSPRTKAGSCEEADIT